MSVVKLNYGENNIHFAGIDNDVTVILSHRENYNAHSFNLLSLYTLLPLFNERPILNIIPFFSGEKESFEQLVSGGADCTLHDFRLLISSSTKKTLIVIADRRLGESFIDNQLVEFNFYGLKHNDDEISGRPTYYFEKFKTQLSKKKYCDVGEAFKEELGYDSYTE